MQYCAMCYEDVQHTPKSLKTLLAVFLGISVVVNAIILFAMASDGGKPDWVVMAGGLLLAPFCLAFTYFIFATSKMRVIIDATEVRVRFRPFHIADRQISWSDVQKCDIRPVNGFGEFGGWGIRWNPFNGKMGYIWGGTDGFELTLNNGKRIVITVTDKDALRRCLDEIQTVTVR
ncbi:MAG: hypothetical protein SGJ05_03600 [bacterium]|nr:hypothetical protein [bacterium]